MTEWLASLASASPESCQEAVADFSSLEAYTERLEDAEAGSAEVPFFSLNFLFLVLSCIRYSLMYLLLRYESASSRYGSSIFLLLLNSDPYFGAGSRPGFSVTENC